MGDSTTVHVNGYIVMRYKFDENSSDNACRYMYLREHKVRSTDDSKPLGRTLFVLSVPPFCNQECLMRLFLDCGQIERVSIQDKPQISESSADQVKQKNSAADYFHKNESKHGYKVAYVVFKKKLGMKASLQISYNDIKILCPVNANKPLVGLQKWCSEYIIRTSPPDPEALQKNIDEYMTKYNTVQAKKLEEELRRDQEADDEGWVTVSRHGKRGALPRTEAHQISVSMKEKKRNKDKELLHFYSYQIRESKKEYVAQLRAKFEEDKQKIALMKASRKFRPY